VIWSLALGVFTTALSLSQVHFEELIISNEVWNSSSKLLILILPITISILAAASSRFRPGSKGILFRASAEAIKREIFRYRTRAGPYSYKETGELSRNAKLSHELTNINNQLLQTLRDRNIYVASRGYAGPIPPKMYGAAANDDDLSNIGIEDYIKLRIDDNLTYLRHRAVQLDWRFKISQWAIYIIGGIGTFLAAVGLHGIIDKRKKRITGSSAIGLAGSSFPVYRIG
jgi:hypothetical protein